jgi:dolichyl-phosphate-mannose-protein mannosyltransferase
MYRVAASETVENAEHGKSGAEAARMKRLYRSECRFPGRIRARRSDYHAVMVLRYTAAMDTPLVKTQWKRWHVWFFLLFVLILSYLTYFHRYWEPHYVFWDENYHIASAQKYLHGVYFMEQHPPLGKLLIAAGEKIFHPNPQSDQFLNTDYGTNFPPGFSFVGYRFFSALLSWWTAPLFFFVFLLLTRNPLISSLLSFPYIFDNALIVHSRGAMLEGPLSFFAMLMILMFFLLLEYRDRGKIFYWLSVAFGASFALVATTKVLGLFLILLIPALVWKLLPQWGRIGKCALSFLAGFILVYCSVWYIHFALGRTINTALPNNGYYQASDAYKSYLKKGTVGSLLSFPVELADSLKYVTFYNAGAPRLDLCKEDENGSPFYFWPLGARSINYRWETPDSKSYLYLYLVANPAVWWSALLGLLLGAAFLVTPYLLPIRQPLRQKYLLTVFLGLYASYMIAISQINRVLYLYHYFLPLLVSFIVLGIVICEIQYIGRWLVTETARTIICIILAGLVFVTHQYYRPLTYYEPMTDAQVQHRAFFPLWELHCVNCEHPSTLVVPFRKPGS